MPRLTELDIEQHIREKEMINIFIQSECIILVKDIIFPQGNTVETVMQLFKIYDVWRCNRIGNDKSGYYAKNIKRGNFSKWLTEMGYNTKDESKNQI